MKFSLKDEKSVIIRDSKTFMLYGSWGVSEDCYVGFSIGKHSHAFTHFQVSSLTKLKVNKET